MNKSHKNLNEVLVVVVILLSALIVYLILGNSKNKEVAVEVKPQVEQPVIIETKTPSITLLSPNGGEWILENKLNSITWDYSDLNKNDIIKIGFRDSKDNICWFRRVEAGLRKVDFVPNNVTCLETGSILKLDEDYKVSLIAEKYGEGMGIADMSDNPFKIVAYKILKADPSKNEIAKEFLEGLVGEAIINSPVVPAEKIINFNKVAERMRGYQISIPNGLNLNRYLGEFDVDMRNSGDATFSSSIGYINERMMCVENFKTTAPNNDFTLCDDSGKVCTSTRQLFCESEFVEFAK